MVHRGRTATTMLMMRYSTTRYLEKIPRAQKKKKKGMDYVLYHRI